MDSDRGRIVSEHEPGVWKSDVVLFLVIGILLTGGLVALSRQSSYVYVGGAILAPSGALWVALTLRDRCYRHRKIVVDLDRQSVVFHNFRVHARHFSIGRLVRELRVPFSQIRSISGGRGFRQTRMTLRVRTERGLIVVNRGMSQLGRIMGALAPLVLRQRCLKCGYMLHHLQSARCPECGALIESAQRVEAGSNRATNA